MLLYIQDYYLKNCVKECPNNGNHPEALRFHHELYQHDQELRCRS